MRVVIALFLALFSTQVFAGVCDTTGETTGAKIWQSRDPRLVKTVAEIRTLSGVDVFAICEWQSGYFEPVPELGIDPGSGRYVILLPHILPPKMSDAGLRGLLAHEMAHALSRLAFDPEKMTILEWRYQIEKNTDALAAEWVGAEAVIIALNEGIDFIVAYERNLLKKGTVSKQVADTFIEMTLNERAIRIEALKALKPDK